MMTTIMQKISGKRPPEDLLIECNFYYCFSQPATVYKACKKPAATQPYAMSQGHLGNWVTRARHSSGRQSPDTQSGGIYPAAIWVLLTWRFLNVQLPLTSNLGSRK